jgi:DNA-directed RNA polymerase specialized sigma24 family protein
MKAEDWVSLRQELQGRLSAEEDRLLQLLVEGKTQPEAGTALGLHRSAVWRRVRKLKKKAAGV